MKNQLLGLCSQLGSFLKNIWSRYSIFFWYGLGIGVVAWMVWKYWDDICKVLLRYETFNWSFLLLALVVNAVSLVITFVRWHLLVRAQNLPFSFLDAIRLGLLGLFWNTFLPGSIAGDIPKGVFLAKEQSRRSVAVGTIIMDRVVGLIGLIWLVALLGTLFWFTYGLEQMVPSEKGQIVLNFIMIISMGVVLGSLAFWFVLGLFPGSFTVRLFARIESKSKIGHSLAELGRAALLYRARGWAVLLALLMAMVAHVGFVSTFYLCSLTLFQGDQNPGIPSARTHFLIVPVGMTIQAGIPTPGGSGGGEAAFSLLYNAVGSLPAQGFMACLLQRLLSWVLAVISILIYLFMKPATPQEAGAKNEAVVPRDPVCEPQP